MYATGLLLIACLPWSLAIIDCRTACRKCKAKEGLEEILEVYCSMCRECRERRREKKRQLLLRTEETTTEVIVPIHREREEEIHEETEQNSHHVEDSTNSAMPTCPILSATCAEDEESHGPVMTTRRSDGCPTVTLCKKKKLMHESVTEPMANPLGPETLTQSSHNMMPPCCFPMFPFAGCTCSHKTHESVISIIEGTPPPQPETTALTTTTPSTTTVSTTKTPKYLYVYLGVPKQFFDSNGRLRA